MLMYEITSPQFNGRFILNNGIVVGGQEPLKFMAGWSLWAVIELSDRQGWVFSQVHDGFPPPVAKQATVEQPPAPKKKAKRKKRAPKVIPPVKLKVAA